MLQIFLSGLLSVRNVLAFGSSKINEKQTLFLITLRFSRQDKLCV